MLELLPTELLNYLFDFLDIKDMMIVSLVSKKINNIININIKNNILSNVIYNIKYNNDYKINISSKLIDNNKINDKKYREIYLKIFHKKYNFNDIYYIKELIFRIDKIFNLVSKKITKLLINKKIKNMYLSFDINIDSENINMLYEFIKNNSIENIFIFNYNKKIKFTKINENNKINLCIDSETYLKDNDIIDFHKFKNIFIYEIDHNSFLLKQKQLNILEENNRVKKILVSNIKRHKYYKKYKKVISDNIFKNIKDEYIL